MNKSGGAVTSSSIRFKIIFKLVKLDTISQVFKILTSITYPAFFSKTRNLYCDVSNEAFDLPYDSVQLFC